MEKITKEWVYAAGIRALRTAAQTALGMFTVGLAMSQINWINVISVSLVAGIFSVLTSVTTVLPELPTDGTLLIDTTSEPNQYLWKIFLERAVSELGGKKTITLKVDPNAILPEGSKKE